MSSYHCMPRTKGSGFFLTSSGHESIALSFCLYRKWFLCVYGGCIFGYEREEFPSSFFRQLPRHIILHALHIHCHCFFICFSLVHSYVRTSREKLVSSKNFSQLFSTRNTTRTSSIGTQSSLIIHLCYSLSIGLLTLTFSVSLSLFE